MKMFKALSLCILTNIIMMSQAWALDLSVTHASFKGAEGNYVEVYLYVIGSTVSFDTLEDGTVQAGVDITITFEQNGDIINYDKFILKSPPGEEIKDFVGIKRFSLNSGAYQFNVSAKDIINQENKFNSNKTIQVNIVQADVGLSDIQLLSSYSNATTQNDFVKNGLFLESCAFNYYPENYDQIAFYIEVYNPSSDLFKANYLRYAIFQKFNAENAAPIMERFKKLKAQSIQAAILKLPVTDLPSGNYEMLVEVRNQDKMLIDAKNVSFQRSNPSADLNQMAEKNPGFENSFASKLDAETTRYSLKAVAPISKGVQSRIIENLFFNDELEPKQFFLYNYFAQINPNNPEAAYTEFMKIAEAIDNTFRSNVGYGFETDRGEIFLKYGRPTEIVRVEDEPSAPPYEIWFYDQLEESKQNNIKFIFFNPSLAGNDFTLLHSNCRGERNNPRWEVELYDNAPNEQVGQNAASTQMEENYRRNARKIWEEL